MSKIHEFIASFTTEKIFYIKIKNNYYLDYSPVTDAVNQIEIPSYSFGLPLGSLKNNKFYTTLALLEILAEKSNKKLIVDSTKIEWLFLCGRDIFKESVTAPNEGLFLVQNYNDENLGLCYVNRRKKEIKNIIDRGDFLRRER